MNLRLEGHTRAFWTRDSRVVLDDAAGFATGRRTVTLRLPLNELNDPAYSNHPLIPLVHGGTIGLHLEGLHGFKGGLIGVDGGLVIAGGSPGAPEPAPDQWIAIFDAAAGVLPMEIGVDNNRDGTLALGSVPDQTSDQKPYRFWLNNDDDTGWAENGSSFANADNYVANRDNPWTPVVVDSLDDKISQARDLEDFARIHLKVDSLHAQLEAGTMTLGFKWKAVQSGAPKIRLFKAVETDGGTKYLSDAAKAADQVSASTSSLGIVQGTTVLDLPVSFWTSTASSATKYFLFEATGEGKGKLTMVFKQGGTVIGEGGSIFLDLLDIRKMYEQWGIADTAVIPDPDVDVLGTISGVTAVSYQEATHAFQPAWDENLTDKDYVICVHGWRKGGPNYPTTDSRYYKGRSDEITIFKRLWHRGFKGRYIGFTWPTFDVEVYTASGNYDGFNSARQSKFPQSEYRAWKCGQAFANFVNGLPSGYKRKIVSHSLGAVVVGSALEKGLAMDKYAARNAAIPAYCYDAGAPLAAATLIGPPPLLVVYDRPPDPSFDANTAITALTYRGDTTAALGKARLESVAGDIINFYLPDDEALGFKGREVNQGITPIGSDIFGKPISSYQYERPLIGANEFQWDPGGTVNRKVTDPHEVMAMINTSRSYALGTQATGGKIGSDIDMNGAGMSFGKEHEAVFKWRCAKTWVFYSKLWDELNLAGTKAP